MAEAHSGVAEDLSSQRINGYAIAKPVGCERGRSAPIGGSSWKNLRDGSYYSSGNFVGFDGNVYPDGSVRIGEKYYPSGSMSLDGRVVRTYVKKFIPDRGKL